MNDAVATDTFAGVWIEIGIRKPSDFKNSFYKVFWDNLKIARLYPISRTD
jgi:hypothetical protein